MAIKSFAMPKSPFSFIKDIKNFEDLLKIHTSILHAIPKMDLQQGFELIKLIDQLTNTNLRIRKEIAADNIRKDLDFLKEAVEKLKDAAEHGESQRLVEELK